jgi:quinol monooxygenase YgiN
MKHLLKAFIYMMGAFITHAWASPLSSEPVVFKGSATLVIKPERVAEFQKAVHDIIGPTRKEAGNLSYEAYQVVDQQGNPTNRFVFHEIWKSEKAMMIDHKENAPHMKRFFSLIGIGTDHSWVESFEVSGNTVKAMN